MCVGRLKVLAVTPSTVLDAHIGYTPDYRCRRCKGTARPIDGRPHNEWLLMQDKNWMLLIHSATLEIRSVLGVVAI